MDLSEIEQQIDFVNGAMRSFDGRFVSKHVPMLTEMARDTSPYHALQAVVILRKKVDELEREAVEIARTNEWSWRDVGAMFGISASAAYRRYGHKEEGPA